MNILLGMIFGYIVFPWVSDFGDRHGWCMSKKIALFAALTLVSAVPLTILGNVLKKAIV